MSRFSLCSPSVCYVLFVFSQHLRGFLCVIPVSAGFCSCSSRVCWDPFIFSSSVHTLKTYMWGVLVTLIVYSLSECGFVMNWPLVQGVTLSPPSDSGEWLKQTPDTMCRSKQVLKMYRWLDGGITMNLWKEENHFRKWVFRMIAGFQCDLQSGLWLQTSAFWAQNINKQTNKKKCKKFQQLYLDKPNFLLLSFRLSSAPKLQHLGGFWTFPSQIVQQCKKKVMTEEREEEVDKVAEVKV